MSLRKPKSGGFSLFNFILLVAVIAIFCILALYISRTGHSKGKAVCTYETFPDGSVKATATEDGWMETVFDSNGVAPIFEDPNDFYSIVKVDGSEGIIIYSSRIVTAPSVTREGKIGLIDWNVAMSRSSFVLDMCRKYAKQDKPAVK